MIILEPTYALNAGCDNQPFWSEMDRGTYPDLYRSKIQTYINAVPYAQNGQTALLIADAREVDPYTWEFRWDISPVLKEYFAQQQRDAGDLPLCFQSSLIGWNGVQDMADSYCKAYAVANYYEIDGQNHEQAILAQDVSIETTFINASTKFDEVTNLDAFNPNFDTPARFLTNCPQRTVIDPFEAAFLSFIGSKDCTQTAIRYRGYMADATLVWTRIKLIDAPSYSLNQIPTGLRQLKQMQAGGDFDISFGTFTVDVDGYTVEVGCYDGDVFTAFTEIYVYEVQENCGMRLFFKNIFGCVDAVTFTGINQITNNPVSRLYAKIMDNTVPHTPQMYGAAKYGAIDYDIYRLSLDDVNGEQRQWLRELQISPLVCMEIGGAFGKTGGDFEFVPVRVDDVEGLIYDRTASVYPLELTMRVAQDKYKSVI